MNLILPCEAVALAGLDDLDAAALGDPRTQDVDKCSVLVVMQRLFGDLYPLRLGQRYFKRRAARVQNVLKTSAAAQNYPAVAGGDDRRRALVRQREINALPRAEFAVFGRVGDEILFCPLRPAG